MLLQFYGSYIRAKLVLEFWSLKEMNQLCALER